MNIKVLSVVSTLALAGGTVGFAADKAAQTTTETSVTTSQQPPASPDAAAYPNSAVSNTTVSQTKTTEGAPMASATPDIKWTEIRGKVKHIDLSNKTLQIEQKGTDKVVEIPVSPAVKVMKSNHHEYALGDLEEGDSVVIRNTDQ